MMSLKPSNAGAFGNPLFFSGLKIDLKPGTWQPACFIVISAK